MPLWRNTHNKQTLYLIFCVFLVYYLCMYSLEVLMSLLQSLAQDAVCASTWVMLTSKIIEPRAVVSESECVFSLWPSSCGKGRSLLRLCSDEQQSDKEPLVTWVQSTHSGGLREFLFTLHLSDQLTCCLLDHFARSTVAKHHMCIHLLWTV